MSQNTIIPNTTQKGKLIAAIGLPGSGKSSVIREIGKLLNAQTFHEPEESEWAEAVENRDISGRFAAMTWFRAIRLPPLYEAHRLRNEGQTVLVDTFYDKLFGFCIGREGMEWLIEKDDPYFEVMKEVSRLDFEHLPDADCLIAFELTYETWLQLLNLRGRTLDHDAVFLQSFATQQYFLEAAQQYAQLKNCHLIRFQQEFSSPQASALKLKNALINAGMLSEETIYRQKNNTLSKCDS